MGGVDGDCWGGGLVGLVCVVAVGAGGVEVGYWWVGDLLGCLDVVLELVGECLYVLGCVGGPVFGVGELLELLCLCGGFGVVFLGCVFPGLVDGLLELVVPGECGGPGGGL